jgi:endonuclease/exonuclease/phosphatase family metal-dependent hydrolase
MKHEQVPLPEGRACPAPDAPEAATDVSLAWYSPIRSGDQKALGKWCTTVGPAVVDSLPTGRSRGWQAGDSLAVVTWNLHGGAGDLLDFIDVELGLSCDERSATPESLSFNFVLLIQEAFRRSEAVPAVADGSTVPPPLKEKPRSGPRADIAEVARRCGLSLFYVPSMRNGREEYEGGREDRGNAILSTLTLSDFIAIELPFEAQRRVAVAATVHNSRRDSLRVVSLHLDVASSLLRLLATGNSTRQRQGLAIEDALLEIELARAGVADSSYEARCYPYCSNEVTPRFNASTMAGGDFNTWSVHETVIKHFYREFPESPPHDGLATRGAYPTDFLFFRRGYEGEVSLVPDSYRLVEGSYHSDHKARIVWLR